MTGTSLDLSGKIDPTTIDVCEAVAQCMAEMGSSYFMIGATARDIILTEGYGVSTGLATQDIDFGVQVPTWAAYEQLGRQLEATGKFKKGRDAQRFDYTHRGAITHIDIVPFGFSADPHITWPPPHNAHMSVLGFAEVFQHAQRVRLRKAPLLDVLFASLAGLVILKLVAWDENASRKKDAQDIYLIMTNYAHAGNLDRIANATELYDIPGMDFATATAYMLGSDIARITTPKTKAHLLKILGRETQEDAYRLLYAMGARGVEDEFVHHLLLFLKVGIESVSGVKS